MRFCRVAALGVAAVLVALWKLTRPRRHKVYTVGFHAAGATAVPLMDGRKLGVWPTGVSPDQLARVYTHVGLWMRVAEDQAAAVVLDGPWEHSLADVLAVFDGPIVPDIVLLCGHGPGVYPLRSRRVMPEEARGFVVSAQGARRLLHAFAETEGKDRVTGRHLPLETWIARQDAMSTFVS